MICNDKVSIIVRTCGRPDVLKTALDSLRRQTYKNIEIIVVEDGPIVSEKMIQEEYNDLPIVYFATIEKKGRSAAGNIGLKIASGTYLNFLDDDDIFYAQLGQHIGRDLTSLCAAGFVMHIFSTDGNFCTFSGLDCSGDVDKRYTKDDVAPLRFCDKRLELFDQLFGACRGFVHFPVAGNNGLTVSLVHGN